MRRKRRICKRNFQLKIFLWAWWCERLFLIFFFSLFPHHADLGFLTFISSIFSENKQNKKSKINTKKTEDCKRKFYDRFFLRLFFVYNFQYFHFYFEWVKTARKSLSAKYFNCDAESFVNKHIRHSQTVLFFVQTKLNSWIEFRTNATMLSNKSILIYVHTREF